GRATARRTGPPTALLALPADLAQADHPTRLKVELPTIVGRHALTTRQLRTLETGTPRVCRRHSGTRSYGRLGPTQANSSGRDPGRLLVDLDVDVVAARAVIEVLDARYDERDTLAQRPQDALRRMRTAHAENCQDAGQRQVGASKGGSDAE